MQTLEQRLRADFEANGFVILPSVFTEEQLRSARELCEQIVEYAEKNSQDLFSNYYLRHRPDQGVLYDLYQRFPEFSLMVRHPKLIEAIRTIYSPNFYLYENCLVYKPKGTRNGVPWHQDFINRPDEPIKVVAWIALDDISVNNGCMFAIPGSHRFGFLPCYTVRGETHHTRALPSSFDDSGKVPLEMKAGDTLLFHQLLLHSSEEVNCTLPRRAFRISYQSFDCSFTPRGTPIVISLQDKNVLKVPHPYEQKKNALVPRLLRNVKRLFKNN